MTPLHHPAAAPDPDAVARRYAEHLTDADLLALGDGRPEQAAALRRQPALVLDLLARPRARDAVLHAVEGEPEAARRVSPFLLLAAAVHRAGDSLVGATHVRDTAAQAGPRAPVPVFDAPVLAAFAADPAVRLFLAELLASYVRVASGVTWRRGPRGWQRQRWDELDLPRLAALLPEVADHQRPGVWRRLGDGALLLAGVYPAWADRALGALERTRLLRHTGLPPALGEAAAVDLLEALAARAYGQAGPLGVPGAVRADGGVRSARRVLALVAEQTDLAGRAWGLSA